MSSDPQKFDCSIFLQTLAKKLTEMSGISKFFKLKSRRDSASATKVPVSTTIKSSVDPECEFIAQQMYKRDRRLVTRTDVRNRMSVWIRLFAWCRGRNKSPQDNETIFTVRS